MIRVAFYLILVGLVALAAAWFADRPGDVAVTWLGMQIETSLMVVVVALVAVVAVAILLWSLLRVFLHMPRRLQDRLHQRRERRGRLALTKGLLAVGAGDAGQAKRYAGEADRFAASEPLTLLLGAQAAQLSGDRSGAERNFRKMTENETTRLLGLRGLYIEAERRADAPAALLYAEEAARLQPALPWAGQAVLQFRSIAGDWNGALEALERNRKSKTVSREGYARQRAVLLTAQAQALNDNDRDQARACAMEAAKLAPDLVPAVVLAARFHSESGEIRKALRLIEKAWPRAPHPDLADAYIHARPGDAARERLARAEKLKSLDPQTIEGALALARAAIDAREFSQARHALAAFLDQPTKRVALLMAALELTESGNEGRAREWTARALRALPDPVWTADGVVSDIWLPVSPVSGRLDAFEWKVPLEALAAPGAAIEHAEMPSVPALDAAASNDAPPASFALEETVSGSRAAEKPAMLPPSAKRPVGASALEAEEIMPLVHVPDDPGPDPEETPPSPGWRQLFS